MKDFVNIMGKDNIFIICSIIVVIILALLVIVIIEKASSKNISKATSRITFL